MPCRPAAPPVVTLVGHFCPTCHLGRAPSPSHRGGAGTPHATWRPALPALPPGPCMPGPLRRGLIGPWHLGAMPEPAPAWVCRPLAPRGHAAGPSGMAGGHRPCNRRSDRCHPLSRDAATRPLSRRAVHAGGRSGMVFPAEGRRNPCRRPRRHGFFGPGPLGSMPQAPPAWPGAINREACEVTDGSGAAVTRRGLVINRAIGEVTVVTVLLSHTPCHIAPCKRAGPRRLQRGPARGRTSMR